jgi:hypothetical protein
MRIILALAVGGHAHPRHDRHRHGPGHPAPPATAKQELERIHGPRSIDEELDHLVKDLELTPT